MVDPNPNRIYDAHEEYHDDSDGTDSWYSEEIETPPNSKDKLGEVDDDEGFPVFREGAKFGKLLLKVGMKFSTKQEFKEAMREYCIQEGRPVWFKKNNNIRCRGQCKGEECPWVVYASKDSEGVCWQS
ncbi:hypothetical protein Ahy_B02g059928 [Arachis hypogaea]|uniref:Transposase MuDR plant domain-containing protein n=1 Tax=Arachis hypogaea TaxID=3818 RepID=A0A445AHM9_ARAHY|nr:hypothetical protein Ahy_B02g059928 [Arachis hypogaea]